MSESARGRQGDRRYIRWNEVLTKKKTNIGTCYTRDDENESVCGEAFYL